ncbi:MAG TPA: hypothetical protein VJY33_00195 [Isosphaeraceae bacterium]|nr:hypothetical protein [Isosphaeraceae bacterium]
MSRKIAGTQSMSSSPRKRRDDDVPGLPQPDGRPGDPHAVCSESPAEDCSGGSRSRPSWQPAPGHETDAGLTAMLQLYLDENYSSDATWRHRLVEVLLDQADQGNVRAIQEIWIRLEGKPGANDTEESKPLDIDPELTAKILEAGRTDDEDPPLD